MRIFLDDRRTAGEPGWTTVRSVDALMATLEASHGQVDAISVGDALPDGDGASALDDVIDRVEADSAFLPRLSLVIVHACDHRAASDMIGRLRRAVNAGVIDVTVAHRPAAPALPIAANDDGWIGNAA